MLVLGLKLESLGIGVLDSWFLGSGFGRLYVCSSILKCTWLYHYFSCLLHIVAQHLYWRSARSIAIMADRSGQYIEGGLNQP